MNKFSIVVNGIDKEIIAHPEMPLLWVLRDRLGLTGTKYSCGIGECGACMVQVDGVATPACVTPVTSVSNKVIRTIEGLSVDHSHPVQQAWIELQVPQCGFCHSGQIMAAVALLEKTPVPSAEDVDQAMSPVLCRCGTYQRIRTAIYRAAEIIRNKQ